MRGAGGDGEQTATADLGRICASQEELGGGGAVEVRLWEAEATT